MIGRSIVCAVPVAVAMALAAPVAAETGGMARGAERTQALIKDLRQLLDRAREKRQADPWLIKDMRDVLAKYEFPWTRTVYATDFPRGSDGAPEPWRVATGTFRVDATGLASVARTQRRETQSDRSKSGTDKSQGDAARELLTSMMEQALGKRSKDKPDRSGQARDEPRPPAQARVRLPKGFANAFATQVTLVGDPDASAPARLVFGPYQGRTANTGYRIVYAADGDRPILAVVKRGPDGTEATVARAAGVPALTDGDTHTLLWTRNRHGRMQIDVDGKQVIDVTDRGFGDPFDGLVLENASGVYTLSSIVVKDVP